MAVKDDVDGLRLEKNRFNKRMKNKNSEKLKETHGGLNTRNSLHYTTTLMYFGDLKKSCLSNKLRAAKGFLKIIFNKIDEFH